MRRRAAEPTTRPRPPSRRRPRPPRPPAFGRTARSSSRRQGCSGCHTLAAAGSTGTTGPDLDGALKGKSAAFIKTSIDRPQRGVAKGYPPNVMPQNFGDLLSPEQIDALVAYLVQSTSGSQ